MVKPDSRSIGTGGKENTMKNIIEKAMAWMDIEDKDSEKAEKAFVAYFEAVQAASEEEGRKARALLSVRSR